MIANRITRGCAVSDPRVSTEIIGVVDALQVTGIDRRIVRVLRKERGWTRRSTLIRGLRTVAADDLTRHLATLHHRGLVDYRIVETATKPAEEWKLR